MKRTLAILLSLAFLAGCTQQGNGGNSGTTATATTAATAASPAVVTTFTRVNSWTKPHVLRYATGEDFNSLNPLLSSQTTVDLMAELTMAWLIKSDDHDRPVPELLTVIPDQHNGGVSKDGKTITFHLRRGVKWSDGVPFSADDVVFSIHQVLNTANNVISRSGWDRIQKIDEPDKYTVVLHLSKPYSPFVETFFSTIGANPAVMPKHLLAQYPNLNNIPYNAKPIGIGPFKYKEWERGQRVVMVPNPLYFRGAPRLKEIDFEIIPDTNTIMTQMEAKQLDLWYAVTGTYANRFKTMTPFTVLTQPNYYFRHVDFNLSSPKLKDKAVREALRYAIDRRTIIDKVYQGVGVLQEQPAPKISAYWDPNIAQVPFDIAKANQILDAAGWKRGPDGVRAKNGVKLDLNFVSFSGAPVSDQTIEQIRSTWRQIGVNITVQHYLESLMFAPYGENGILYRGKFDVTYFSWGLGITGDLSNLYSCDLIPPQGQNILHWCNPKANRAMHQLYSHYDQSQRNADDAIVMSELVKDVPTVVMMGTELVWAYNKDLHNFHPGAVAPFDDFMNVDI